MLALFFKLDYFPETLHADTLINLAIIWFPIMNSVGIQFFFIKTY